MRRSALQLTVSFHRVWCAVAGGLTLVTSGVVAAQAPGAEEKPAPPAVENKFIPSPQPGALDVEKAHIARYDAAIAAARRQEVSAADVEKLKQAMARVSAGDPTGALALREQITEPIVRKMADWFRLRGGFGEAKEYREFLAANPVWASREILIQRYEEALFTEGGPARAMKDLFKAEPPRTGAGFAALASAHLSDGDEEGARVHARKAWREYSLAATLETGFIARFGKLLTVADHRWRFDRILMDDPRWTADRNERVAIARRILPLLPEAERRKAEARMAVFLRNAKGAALLAALPAEEKPDWGLAFQRIQSLRRAGKVEEAAKGLLAAPLDGDTIVSPDGWWNERRAVAYEALRIGNPRLAYDVVKAAGPLTINPLKDQAFLAGWIALSHLKDAKLALPHMDLLRRSADGPLSRAKAGYWHGRALAAVGRRKEAEAAWREAATVSDTFHGQLARVSLDPKGAVLHAAPPAAPSAAEVERFGKLEAARAAVIAKKAKLDMSIHRAFLIGMQRVLTSEAELGMVAHLAEALGDTQQAVRTAKAGVARGLNVVLFSYPLHAFPSFTALRVPTPEMPLLLGIARQESEFHGGTLSGAGARGILQVMPITARHVCKDYKIKCDIPRLMTDNSYNTMMATAYVGDRMREFAGSYILGIAGYNAGPGRARQWIREFGDPRDPKVDPIDWIHRIPFEETREYTQKVLSNVQVYRARLGSGPVRLGIAEDLVRARGQTALPVATSEPGTAGAAASE